MVALFTVSLVQFVTYQVLTWHAFDGLSPTELTSRGNATTARSVRDRRRVALLAGGPKSWSSTAALFALAAALLIAVNDDLRTRPPLLILSFLAVLSGWTMVVVAYAVQYLRLDTANGGLDFPGSGGPRWRDYVYLAVQVSTTSPPLTPSPRPP